MSRLRQDLSPFVRALNLSGRRIDDGIDAALHAARTHLDMDIGFISEFTGSGRIFRKVDARGEASPVFEGLYLPDEVGYCRKVVEGRLPMLIPDTGELPEARAIPETRTLPIGAHMSVPIRLRNGRIFGTFCCFNFLPHPSLNLRDLQVMSAFAEVVAFHIDAALNDESARQEKAERIGRALASPDPLIVFQPIVRLSDRLVLANEALARFSTPPCRSPDQWFAEAAEVELSAELELKAIRQAVQDYARVFDAGHPCALHVNCSPHVVLDPSLPDALRGLPAEHLVLELTEHQPIPDYEAFAAAVAPLRRSGVRLAIDDVGAGYASMRHVLHIRPEIIKMDVSLTRSVDTDDVKRALASAVCEFGRKTRSAIIAEAVETEAEAEALRALGVDQAQGYLFGRPEPLGAVRPACH